MLAFAMHSRPPRHLRVSRESGISLIEIMVGLVIGLIATAVILQTFAVSEGYKRNTTGAGDAQQNGLFSTFTLALELANAGNGLATSGVDLATCPNTGDIATTLRPIPALITDSGDKNTPDSFVVQYSASNTLVYPALLLAATPKGGTSYVVQSPGGFRVGDMVVPISEGGQCEWQKVTNVSAPDPATGAVTVTVSTPSAQAYSASGTILTMGPWDRAQRVRYDVMDANGAACSTASTNCVLRATDLNPADPNVAPAAAPQPLASNIVNMKVQYGIDNTGDGVLDTWVSAQPPWDGNTLLGATLPVINQIKAIRIGIIVRSAQYDRGYTNDFNWVLFDCPTHDNACPGRLTGTIKADPNGLGAYRYRVYETVVPLRNQLWNKHL